MKSVFPSYSALYKVLIVYLITLMTNSHISKVEILEKCHMTTAVVNDLS